MLAAACHVFPSLPPPVTLNPCSQHPLCTKVTLTHRSTRAHTLHISQKYAVPLCAPITALGQHMIILHKQISLLTPTKRDTHRGRAINCICICKYPAGRAHVRACAFAGAAQVAAVNDHNLFLRYISPSKWIYYAHL